MSNELMVNDTSLSIKAELDTQIITANQYPRDEIASVEKAIKLACMDEETSAGCFYALPRKDKDGNKIAIEGESIRLAEIMRCVWGHMHTQTRVVDVTEKYIVTEAVCWDLQTGNKHVEADRISIWFGEKNGKGGYRANNDMQIMLGKASQAKALRNAIFQIVPKGLVKIVANAAKKNALGDSKNFGSKVTAVINKLVKMGLNKEEMLAYFGHSKIDDFTQDDLAALIGIGTALKDGLIKPEDVFAVEKLNDTSASETLNLLIASKDKPKVDAITGEIESDLPY